MEGGDNGASGVHLEEREGGDDVGVDKGPHLQHQPVWRGQVGEGLKVAAPAGAGGVGAGGGGGGGEAVGVRGV